MDKVKLFSSQKNQKANKQAANFYSRVTGFTANPKKRGMGDHNFRHNHQAIDGLVNLLTKSNHELTMVQYKLDKEFQQIYPDNVSKPNLAMQQILLHIFVFIFYFFPYRQIQ